MAFMEGKLQMIDLLGALSAKRQQQDREEERKRAELQNKMMLQEMQQQQWRNQMEKAPDTITVKGVGYDPRFGFGTEKRFLTDMPGMITGVSPETVYKNIGETDRAMINAMRGGGGGGGQTPEMADLLNAQTNEADERARIAQYKRQGYGSAGADLLEQRKMEAEQAKNADLNKRMVDIANIDANARTRSAELAKEAAIGSAEISTTGKKELKDTVTGKDEYGRKLKERESLYKMDSFKFLDENQKALIDRNVDALYMDSIATNTPIPWERIIADVANGTSKLK